MMSINYYQNKYAKWTFCLEFGPEKQLQRLIKTNATSFPL